MYIPFPTIGPVDIWAHADAGWRGYRIARICETATGWDTKTSIQVRDSAGIERTEPLPYTVQAGEAIRLHLAAGESLVPGQPRGELTLTTPVIPIVQAAGTITPTTTPAQSAWFEVSGPPGARLFYDALLPSGYTWQLLDEAGVNVLAERDAAAERQLPVRLPGGAAWLVIHAPEPVAGLWSTTPTEVNLRGATGHGQYHTGADGELLPVSELYFPFDIVTDYQTSAGDVAGPLSADLFTGQAAPSADRLPPGGWGVIPDAQSPKLALRDETGQVFMLTFTAEP